MRQSESWRVDRVGHRRLGIGRTKRPNGSSASTNPIDAKSEMIDPGCWGGYAAGSHVDVVPGISIQLAYGYITVSHPSTVHFALSSLRMRPSMNRLPVRLRLAALVFASAGTANAQRAAVRHATDVVYEATISDLQSAMAQGRLTSVDLVDAYLARIDAYDHRGPSLNAIVRLNPRARADAAALDAERKAGRVRGPLHGIPIILKDNYGTRDFPTSAGSIALAGMQTPDDAFQVQKLREAGAVILGKSNMHELASGITTISSIGGQTCNPYDPDRAPGGSSGGSGAAVAASFAAIAWGSDTCGSIRIPSAVQNLFGLRPTKGLSSIHGIVPLSHTQDVGGPLARTVRDLAIGLDATVGPDPADTATRILDGHALPRFVDALDSTALRGTRLGVLTAHFGTETDDAEGTRVVRASLEKLRARGAEVVDVAIPELDSLINRASVIDYEFKYDLIDYLAGVPNAPVKSLGEILDRGLYHTALEAGFRRREAQGTRDGEAYRAALARRVEAREPRDCFPRLAQARCAGLSDTPP